MDATEFETNRQYKGKFQGVKNRADGARLDGLRAATDLICAYNSDWTKEVADKAAKPYRNRMNAAARKLTRIAREMEGFLQHMKETGCADSDCAAVLAYIRGHMRELNAATQHALDSVADMAANLRNRASDSYPPAATRNSPAMNATEIGIDQTRQQADELTLTGMFAADEMPTTLQGPQDLTPKNVEPYKARIPKPPESILKQT